MLGRLAVLPSILFGAVLGFACGEDSPSAPSPITAAPPPIPSPVPDFSALVGVWNLRVRLTEVEGGGCVADTMRSQIGEPKPYTLSITPKNSTVSVTLRTASGDRACTFTPVADSSSFTTQHNIFSVGEDISGHLSGNEMTGAWGASWFDGWEDYSGVRTTAQFTATK
jgi:hypothetical protein